ncbi:MAG: class I SAM-dependent methyltransferase [Bacteroidetes bacterium]|nr:class I SAM-dependent methyltransferase [Bacteroidota bacterium]
MTSYLNSNFDLNATELVDVFDELPFWAAPFGIKLLDRVNYHKKITALDIGFGAGFPLTELAMRMGSSSKVYGIDPWKSASDRTRKKLALYGIQNVELIDGVAESIPLEDKSVDLIISNNGLNNVSDLDKVLTECARISKPEAQLVFTFNANTTFHEFYDLLAETLKEEQLTDALDKMNEQIYTKRKPLSEFKEELINHGFSIASVDEEYFEYKFADGTSMLNHYFIRLAFIGGWKNIIPTDKQSTIFKIVEEKMNQQSSKDGFFRMSVPFYVISGKYH